MKTIALEISTKKGETQKLRWLVVQDIPYPGITGEAGRLAWRNFGGLFHQYGSKAQGIGKNYWCYLLADIRFEGNPAWPTIKVNGFDSPSSGEREAITNLVCPALRSFIAENSEALKDYAVKQIKTKFATELKEASERLTELKHQADHEAVY